jgi:hypothetical protein
MHYFILALISVLGALIHVFSKKKKKTNDVFKIFLLWIIFWNVGVGGLLGFFAHAFMADQIALFIGWMPGSQFQFEIAVANLMMGILGILCWWYEYDFWFAIVIAATIFGWGAGYGHVRDMMLNANYAPGNAGMPLYIDMIQPVVLIVLLIGYKMTLAKAKPKKKR